MKDTIERRFADIESRLLGLEENSKSKMTDFQRNRSERLLLLLKEHDEALSFIEIGKIFGVTKPRVSDLIKLFIEKYPEYKVIRNPESKRGKMLVRSEYELYLETQKTCAGVVYILGSARSEGLYKIGRTLDVTKRIASLNCGSPDPLCLVHSILTNDPISAERILHKKYDVKRTKGEWFALNDMDIKFIKTLNYLSADGLRLLSGV
jgi:predicted XRE-type DNA-binding protein